MLAAGLKGIEEEYELQPPCEKNIYSIDEKEGIKTLPKNLSEAIEITGKSDMVRKTLGDHLFKKFIANKEAEISGYRREMGHKYDATVSPFEIEHNLSRL